MAAPFTGAAEEISTEEIVDLPPADIVVLGEVHDNPLHHENQARAVGALAPNAIVFEMLTPEQAARVTPEIRGDASALEEVLGWAESGWPDFDLYFPIFAAAPEAAVFGGGLPQEEARRAATEGAAAVLGKAAPLFGLDEPLPPEQAAEREAGQQEAHCNALTDEVLPGMVEAQRARDAALAQAVVAAYVESGGPVVLIAGTGHARTDWGVPHALSLARPDLTVVSVGQLESPPEEPAPFDLWLTTEPSDRPDPCASFR